MTTSLPTPRPGSLERLRLRRPSAERSQLLEWKSHPRRWIVGPEIDPPPNWRLAAAMGDVWMIPKPEVVTTFTPPRVPLRTAGRTPL